MLCIGHLNGKGCQPFQKAGTPQVYTKKDNENKCNKVESSRILSLNCIERIHDKILKERIEGNFLHQEKRNSFRPTLSCFNSVCILCFRQFPVLLCLPSLCSFFPVLYALRRISDLELLLFFKALIWYLGSI